MLTPSVAPLPIHLPTAETRAQVELMAAIGLDSSQMAYLLRCTPSEIAIHYPSEVEHGLASVTADVATALVAAARGGDTQAAKYWLEVRAKWKAPVQVAIVATLDVDERKQLLDSILGIVNVTPQPQALPTSTRLAAPAREQ